MLSAIPKCVRTFAARDSLQHIWRSNRLFATMGGDSYTLKYFNFRVLGEPIRWQFALAGVPFTDQRIARDEAWDAEVKYMWRPYIRESDPVKKKILEKEMVEVNFPFYLPRFEDFIKKMGGKEGYAVGDSLTWADLYLANFIEIWTDNHGKELIASYPLLQQHMKKILDIPQIKEWNAKRPVTKF
ncbi:probable glutathione S-transferase 5 isoform X2 [Folsomia candida]|uniref:probable glutathione S-transferase 5 isoform X2 n=1 Tax=Folsomia candida TaxID=158441 RepID=UPI0016054371|nr:probable glutathione S-transferase 5 isoform X2 [Folsomia candida]